MIITWLGDSRAGQAKEGDENRAAHRYCFKTLKAKLKGPSRRDCGNRTRNFDRCLKFSALHPGARPPGSAPLFAIDTRQPDERAWILRQETLFVADCD